MKQKKKSLKFKKIRIANMNLLKGGGNEEISVIIVCITQDRTGCVDSPVPASDPDNPCSDYCNASINEPCTGASVGSFFCETTSL